MAFQRRIFKFLIRARMGVVKVIEESSNKQLEQITVYTVTYQRGLEKDVQDVHITSLVARDENGGVTLIVTDEKHRTHNVDVSRFYQ